MTFLQRKRQITKTQNTEHDISSIVYYYRAIIDELESVRSGVGVGRGMEGIVTLWANQTK